jgi:SAM-dependent methyltransferase
MRSNLQPKGWFAIPGVQSGDRTLDEQIKGLEPMLADVKGRSVLDLGCAEGLISQVVLAHGAARLVGLDYNAGFVARAQQLVTDARAKFGVHDLNAVAPHFYMSCHADVVLALAVIHKLKQPAESLKRWASLALHRFVIRLPTGSAGEFGSKYEPKARCDTRVILPDLGFVLEHDLEGPRGERVQHWLRKAL